MLDSDKKMLVEHVVEKVFIPDVMIVLHGFIAKMSEQIIYAHEYKKEIGLSVHLPPVVLDLREVQERLAVAIVTVTKDYPPKQ